MAGNRKLTVVIAGSVSEFRKSVADVDADLEKFSTRTDRAAEHMKSFGVGSIAVGGAVVGALGGLAKASEDANRKQVLLRNTIANSTNLVGANVDAFNDLATAIQRKTAADGDDIVGAQAMLGQFKLTEQQILSITPLVVDLSRKMGIDLDTSAKTVGKAIDGNAGALGKMGIKVDEAAYKTDKYKAVQDALARSVGGFAEDEGKTFAGRLESLKNQLGDLGEIAGGGAVKGFEDLLTPLTNVSAKLAEVNPAVLEGAGQFGVYAGAATVAVGAMSMVAGKAVQMRDNLSRVTGEGDDATRSLTGMGKAAVGVAAGLTAIGASQTAFLIINDINDASGKAERSLQKMIIAADKVGETDPLGAFADMAKVEDKTLRLSHLWEDWGRGIEITGAKGRRQIEDIDRAFSSVLKTSPAAAKTLLDTWRAQNETLDHSSQQYKDNASLVERYQKRLELTAGATKALDNQTQELGDTNDETADAVERLNAELDAQHKRTLAARAAIDDLVNSTLNAFSSDLSYRSSVRATKEAIDEFRKATTDKAEKLDEATEAALREAGAMAKLAEDQAKARGETLSTAEAAAIQRTELGKLAATLKPGDPLRARLDEYIARLDAIPAVKQTVVTLGMNGQPLIDEFNRTVRSLTDQGVTDIGAITALIPLGLASGGIARARPGGTIARIGEGGRDEAVIPLPSNWRSTGIGGGSSDGVVQSATFVLEMGGTAFARVLIPDLEQASKTQPMRLVLAR